MIVCDEHAPRIGKISRNDGGRVRTAIGPDDDLTVPSVRHNDRVASGDKDAMREETDGVIRGERGGIGVPSGIRAEFRLIE